MPIFTQTFSLSERNVEKKKKMKKLFFFHSKNTNEDLTVGEGNLNFEKHLEVWEHFKNLKSFYLEKQCSK